MPAYRAPLLALVSILFGALPLRAQDACEGDQKEVRDLEFHGNSALSDGDLALRITTTPSDFVVRNLRLSWLGTKRCVVLSQLPRDASMLRNYYRLRGFYQVHVDTATRPAGRDGVRVIFNIVEGPPTIVTSYSVSGLDGQPDSAAIMRNLQLRVGGRFDQLSYFSDVDAIIARLRNSGHFRATASPAYDRHDSTKSATAEITVTPGPVTRFGELVLEVLPVDSALGQQISDRSSATGRSRRRNAASSSSPRIATSTSRRCRTVCSRRATPSCCWAFG
jgi:outer membrane protein assembly factor BamA